MKKLLISIFIALFVLQGESMAEENKFGLIPTVELVYWSSLGRINLVEDLLDKGADPSTFDDGGYSALQAASENNHLEIVKILISKGANVNYKSQFTALDLAKMAKNEEIVAYLKKHGAK